MLDRLLDLFRGKPVVVRGTGKLPEGSARKIDVGDVLAGGKSVLLCRVGGKLHALDTRCPHDGGRLIEGPLVDGKLALCPLHNYTFDPATGAVVRGACSKATVYKVREKDGDAQVWA